jgi:RHS repeat-associated protein
LTDSASSVVGTYEYDSYGNTLSSTGSVPNPYGFSTKEISSTSGLIYFGARYYNPELGRWLSPDPLGMVNGPNLYAYCNNNPTNLIDPWGLQGNGGNFPGGNSNPNKCPKNQTPTNVDEDPMQDILDAYAWLYQHHPEITDKLNPAFFAVHLPPGYAGLYVGNDTILIDPNHHNSKDELVNTIAHELMHAKQGFWKTAFIREKDHWKISEKAEAIRREYLEWEGNQ